jgi:hypothetical protein
MFFVHEIHALHPAQADEFETALRDQWVPALAEDEHTRLVWCVRSMPAAISFPELITLTAVEDGAALERLGERMRGGDLRGPGEELGQRRRAVTTRVLAPLEEFNPYQVDLTDVPLTRRDAPTRMYIHDFVVPQPAMQRRYEIQMREAFMTMLDLEGLQMLIWAGLETVAGGGRTPLSLMLTHIGSAAAGADLLAEGNPRVRPEPGTWMHEGLQLRDTWVSRLVRSVPWSPTS